MKTPDWLFIASNYQLDLAPEINVIHSEILTGPRVRILDENDPIGVGDQPTDFPVWACDARSNQFVFDLVRKVNREDKLKVICP